MTDSDWYKNCFYRVSLKALIRDKQNRILVVTEKNGDSSLPGGGLDYGESTHEGLKRELYEEVALNSPFGEKLVGMQTRWLETKQAWLMWLVYEIHYDQLDFSLGEHGDSVQWLYESQLDLSLPAHVMIKTALKDAARYE